MGKLAITGGKAVRTQALHGLADLQHDGRASAASRAGQPELGRLSISQQHSRSLCAEVCQIPRRARYGLAVTSGTRQY